MRKRKQTIEQRQKQAISRLTNENIKLRDQNKELLSRVAKLEAKIEE